MANSALSDLGFLIDDNARVARLRRTMWDMVDADARGERAGPSELDAGFSRERMTVAVEDGRVHLMAQDADGRTVRLRMPWPSATTSALRCWRQAKPSRLYLEAAGPAGHGAESVQGFG